MMISKFYLSVILKQVWKGYWIFLFPSIMKSSLYNFWGSCWITCLLPRKPITTRSTNSLKDYLLRHSILLMNQLGTTFLSFSSRKFFLSSFNSTAKTNSSPKPKSYKSTLIYWPNSNSGKTSLNSTKEISRKPPPVQNFISSNSSENPPITNLKRPNPSKSIPNSVKPLIVLIPWSKAKTQRSPLPSLLLIKTKKINYLLSSPMIQLPNSSSKKIGNSPKWNFSSIKSKKIQTRWKIFNQPKTTV